MNFSFIPIPPFKFATQICALNLQNSKRILRGEMMKQ